VTEAFDAVVIGAGEAGAVVASRAVAAGQRVAMIYRPPYGSTCVNVGCVPSKFLIQRANVAHAVRTAGRFGVEGRAEPAIDLAAIVAEKDALVAAHRAEALGNARPARGLSLIEGGARFLSPREVAVGERRLSSERIFIATGSRPEIPDLPGLEQVAYFSSDTLMDLTAAPKHLIVLGGGYIGCELGQAYRRFGSQVTIVQGPEMMCADEEPDVSRVLGRALRADRIDVLLNQRAAGVETIDGGIVVRLLAADGAQRAVSGSHLLVATGRVPNTDTLDVAAAGLSLRPDGAIPVDDRMRTSVAGIWAVGDVNGQQPFTRVAQEEAKVAYADAFDRTDVRIERRSLGHAVFTDPEVASVGLTEAAARAQGYDVAAGLVGFDQVEKAELIGQATGLIKYVVERGSGRLLGAHLIGPDAANLVYAATVVMRRGGTLEELATAVGIFPTLAEGIEGTARGLLRRLAPERVRGPLVASGVAAAQSTVAASAADVASFACPACAGEFELAGSQR
jgi:pyruvate/2-oxoglutarate dehydrogenase complex dihydrolipoamide dehydrogenase (E3) component